MEKVADNFMQRLVKGVEAASEPDKNKGEWGPLDEQGLKAMGANLALTAPVTVGTTIYGRQITRPKGHRAIRSVKDLVNIPGLSLPPAYIPEEPESKLFKELVKSVGKSGVKLDKGITLTSWAAGPHYLPNRNEIVLNGITDPGILAHEFGHAQSIGPNAMKEAKGVGGLLKKIHRGAYAPSKLGSGLAGLLAMTAASPAGQYLTDQDLAGIGIGGTAIASPMIGEEIIASSKGYKELRRLGASRLKALGSFKGVPTYLAAAALGFAPWLQRKWVGGYAPDA